MKYQKLFLLSASCFLMALLCSILWGYRRDQDLTERLASRLLRFHVLANSNSQEDQAVKNQVKQLVLEQLRNCPGDSKEDICLYVENNRETLENYVDQYISNLGYDYHADITVAESWFPTKAYGDLVLPCGPYDAVQVTLGQGRGRNWWCVLYPRLCFIDSTHAVLPDESREQLKNILSEEDYLAVMDTPAKIHIRFKFLELLTQNNSPD